jgi:ADP-ribose pyrophosphatase YjhB (NUDIX family)
MTVGGRGVSTKKRLRPLALGIFRQGDRVFVTKGYDPVKDQVFYRPLGGAIEFGERGADTVAREIKEEIGAQVTDLRYLTTLENIFTNGGEPGHEIILLYEGTFVDPSWYERDVETGLEQTDDPPLMQGIWMRLDNFGSDAPLYPDGLLEVIRSHTPKSGTP